MSRKIETSMWRDGKRRRRSPRITAMMDASKESQQAPSNSGCMLHLENCKGPPSGTRTRMIKRKLDEVGSDAVSTETSNQLGPKVNISNDTSHGPVLLGGGDDSQHHKDKSTSRGKPIQLPEKRILELILDTLQRRDINEIFAEPVDPSEVEDYYDIVKEPMDFGTMRAKLHEGMYQNLEQFEHDVFLIPTNAMHFNSTGSIYFRQARAIHELAKKVFHVLKTDPGNFELEFSGTRRRSIRKATGEAKTSRQSMDPITGGINKDISSKCIRDSLSGPSVFKRSKGSQVINVAGDNNERKYYDFCSDARKNTRLQSAELDRRCTYRTWKSPFNNDNNLEGATIYSDPRPQILINQDISYKESLMLFVKDLGPTAQIIAKKKLKGWLESYASCQTTNSSCSIQGPQSEASTALETASWRFLDAPATGKSDLAGAKYRIEGLGNSRMGHRNTEMKGTSTKRYDTNVVRASKRDKVTKKCKSREIRRGFSSSKSGAGDLRHSSIVGKKDTGSRFPEQKADKSRWDDSVLPVVLALEHSRPNDCELKSRSKKNSTEALLPSMTTKVTPEDGGMSRFSRPTPSKYSETKKSMALFSGFTFDMPFLKAQLNQMNGVGAKGVSFGQEKYEPSAAEEATSTKPNGVSFLYKYNQLWPNSSNPMGTNLTLQL